MHELLWMVPLTLGVALVSGVLTLHILKRLGKTSRGGPPDDDEAGRQAEEMRRAATEMHRSSRDIERRAKRLEEFLDLQRRNRDE